MGVKLTGDIDPNLIKLQASNPGLRQGVIKRAEINYSVPQMVRFGMLPYSALEEYLKQQEEAKRQEEAAAQAAQTESAKPAKEERKNHTFWEDDDGDREMLSQEDYEKFLRENAIDLSAINPLANF